MEMRHISLFCLIRENQSISKAARVASLSQPTVSQHLKALESELGVPLFDRTGRNLIPTQAGELFYTYARRMVDLLKEARHALDEHMDLIRGDLWMAGSTIPGQYLLPPIIGSFYQLYPEVKPHLLIGDSEWVIDRICALEVELGFVGAHLERPGLVFWPFARDELILVTSPQHELSARGSIHAEELYVIPFLSRERGSGTRTIWEHLLREADVSVDDLRVVAELGSTEAIIRAVRAGLGVGIVSRKAVEEDLRRGSIVRLMLDGPKLERTFYMLHQELRGLSPAARTFKSFVQSTSRSDTGHRGP